MHAQERFVQIPLELKSRKLYAADFKALGVTYTDAVQCTLDISRFIGSHDIDPDYAYKHPHRVPQIRRLQEIARSELDNPYRPALYLKYINDTVGFGAFADEPIEEGQLVIEYTGCLVLDEDCEADGDFAMEVGRCYRTDKGPILLSVDAKNTGNFSRFINHSYHPNVDSMTLFNPKDGLFHVLLHAKDPIEKNAQLFINYGEGYWFSRTIEPVDLTANS